MMVGVNISDEQLGSIADRTIQEADQNGDSSISFNEFIKVTFPRSLNELIQVTFPCSLNELLKVTFPGSLNELLKVTFPCSFN